jgi:hypothetical protein
MGKTTKPSAARLKELHSRQGIRKWHGRYEAALRATKDEAPAFSRPTQVWSPRSARYWHAMSTPEADWMHILMYHPDVAEALDQYLLPTVSAPHYLTGSPYALGQALPEYRGTVAVADELGYLDLHPTIRTKVGSVPFPFIGDILVIMSDAGSHWPINFSIKNERVDFERPYQAGPRSRFPEKALRKVRGRHAIEEQLHLDAGTKTVRATSEDYTRQFARNLRWSHLWRVKELKLNEAQRNYALDAFRLGLEKEVVPFSVMTQMASKKNIPVDQAKIVLAEAIFKRQLLVEMETEAFLLDQPFKMERKNPLDRFKQYFSR